MRSKEIASESQTTEKNIEDDKTIQYSEIASNESA